MNESCLIWMSHVSYEWVVSYVNESFLIWISHVSYSRVMSHIHESCLIWIQAGLTPRHPSPNTLHHTASHCSTLQHTDTQRALLQHPASHCSKLQHTNTQCRNVPAFCLRGPKIQEIFGPRDFWSSFLWHKMARRSGVECQCVAVCCSVMQCDAVC